jgi:hypothetical protein
MIHLDLRLYLSDLGSGAQCRVITRVNAYSKHVLTLYSPTHNTHITRCKVLLAHVLSFMRPSEAKRSIHRTRTYQTVTSPTTECPDMRFLPHNASQILWGFMRVTDLSVRANQVDGPTREELREEMVGWMEANMIE